MNTKKIIIGIIVLAVIIILFLEFLAYRREKKRGQETANSEKTGSVQNTSGFQFNSTEGYNTQLSALEYQLAIQSRRSQTLTGEAKVEAEKIVSQLNGQINNLQNELQSFINSKTLSTIQNTLQLGK